MAKNRRTLAFSGMLESKTSLLFEYHPTESGKQDLWMKEK
jgi:hypothetical protein